MFERRGFLRLLARAGTALPALLLGGGLLGGGWARLAMGAPKETANTTSVPLGRLKLPWSVAEFEFTKLIKTHRGLRPSSFPGYLVRLPAAIGRRLGLKHNIFAVSRICPHEGCPINIYTKLSEVPAHMARLLKIDKFPNPLLVCTCHQSVFDPAQGGKVLEGPAPRKPWTFDIALEDGTVVIKDMEPGGEKWG